VNLHKCLALRSNRKITFGHQFSTPLVAPNDSPFVPDPLRDRLITTFWELSTAGSPESTPERTPRTNPPRCGQDHECVCALEQKVVVDVIAVNNPLLTGKQGALLLEELAFWHPDPAGIPTVEVEMDNRKASSS